MAITAGEIRKALAGLADEAVVRLRLTESPSDGLEVEFTDVREDGGALVIIGEAMDGEDGNVTDECVACGQPVAAGEAESTYCGTVHDVCLDEHKQGCAICDDGDDHHGDNDDAK